jgi:Mce-associated membrane protein
LVTGLVLAALLVGLVVTAGLLGTRAHDQAAVDRARDRALAAARTEAQAFLSYDYRTLDADFAKARAGLTGRFAGEYATTTQKVVRPTATQYKAQVKAEVISLGVVDARADQVVVIAFVDQTTTSSRLAGPKVDANRVRLTLVPVRGQWKVSAVDAL